MKGKTWMAGALCSIVLLQSICSQTILAVYADTLTLNEQNIMQTESASAAFSMSESMVNQSVSDHTISNHTISNNTISNNTVSDNTVSDNTISDNTASDHTVSGNTISDNTISENIIRRSFQLHMEYVDESICADAKKQNERREKYLNFLQQITDFPTQISYEEQMYAFLADTREQADLIALVYSGTILSYEEGVATMQIEGYSTAEVLTACLEEEAAAAPVIYPIEYTETEVDGSNESSEEMLLLTKDEAGRVQICDQPNTQLNEQPQNTRLVSTVEQLKAANTALLPPTISIPSGRIQEGWGFRLYNSNSLGQIYYTTDGTTPTKHSLSYHIEKDEKGLIYVPENNTKVTIKAIVVYQDQKSKILTTNYLVSPYTIAINDASHRYVTSLNKLGCFSSYYPIRGFTKGTNMPYQLYSVRLNSGDTLTATLEAAGFNGEVYILTNDSVLAHQTGTPETANRPSIPRIARYTNPYNYSLNCIIAVTSGENSAVHRMYLSNGGEYELTVFSAKRAKDVRVSMTKDYMISGRDMFYNVSMVPYDTYNRSSKLELLYEDDTKVPSNVAIINRKKGIVHLYKVNAPTKMKLRATNIDSQAYGEFEFTAYPVIQKMIPKKDRVTLVLTSIRTHDASTNFAMTPLSGYYNQFTYTSSRPQVADVTEAGLVTAYTEGTTVITR
ncbi:MAG: hypothetical protein GX567_05050, partial [Clostridia bacterium]|nr:hypothetical protein [Clostridia bacterium]